MSAPDDEQDRQNSRPKRGKPIQIPVPARKDVERDLKKLIAPERKAPSTKLTRPSPER